MCLDKDILIKGNKVYSPETCIFIPSEINTLFVKNDVNRGEFPIGVTFNKENNNYLSHCNNGHRKIIHLGTFNNIEDAFKVYKEYKEKIIKQIAEEYKSKIPEKIYNAMINYDVEITD
jgi:hypothetical protein